MTVYYVDDTATGANNGTSWTNAWTTITSVPDTTTAADEIRVRNTHTEGATSLLFDSTWAGSGNEDGGPLVISMNTSDVYTTGATIDVTGDNLRWIQSGRYFGITFQSNVGMQNSKVVDEYHYFKDCTFKLTAADDFHTLNNGGMSIYEDCTWEYNGTGGDNLGGWDIGTGYTLIINPSFVNNSIKNYIMEAPDASIVRVIGGDFSGFSGVDVVNNPGGAQHYVLMYGCKMPASYTLGTGSAYAGAWFPVQLIACDDDTSNDRYNMEWAQEIGRDTSELQSPL